MIVDRIGECLQEVSVSAAHAVGELRIQLTASKTGLCDSSEFHPEGGRDIPRQHGMR